MHWKYCSLAFSHQFIVLVLNRCQAITWNIDNQDLQCSRASQSNRELTMGWNEALYNSLAPGRFQWNILEVIFKLISVIGGWAICSEIGLTCHWTLLMISQHWFREWLGTTRQAITWASIDPDLCGYMAPLGHNAVNRGTNLVLVTYYFLGWYIDFVFVLGRDSKFLL